MNVESEMYERESELNVGIFLDFLIMNFEFSHRLHDLKINPLVPDAHYSVRRNKQFHLQNQRLEVN